jgi:RNA recognition motif-containing protein
MGTKLYVGNLSKNTTEDDLTKLFGEAGAVVSVAIPTDTKTGVRKSFGFVEMGTVEAASAAIQTINGRMLDDHELRVNESRSKN